MQLTILEINFVMDPLLSVNKAYSMTLRVEKQRKVHAIFGESTERDALVALKITEGKEINYG